MNDMNYTKPALSKKKKKEDLTGWYFITHDHGEKGCKDLYGPFSSKTKILKLGVFPENIVFLQNIIKQK